jgi:Tfp pilus assembly protein PilZ
MSTFRVEKAMLERRVCERFVVPGSAIAYKVQGFFTRNRPYTDNLFPVTDLSKGGLSFLTDKPLKEGKALSIILHISEKESSLQLEGKIAYVLINPAGSYRYRVGLKFNPFGTKKRFNPLENLKRLEELEKTYGAMRKL